MRMTTPLFFIFTLFASQLSGCDDLFRSQKPQTQEVAASPPPSPQTPQALAQTILDDYGTCLETCLNAANQENRPTCQLNCQAVAEVDMKKVEKANEEPGVEKVNMAQLQRTLEHLEGCMVSCTESNSIERKTNRETCYLNCRAAHQISQP